MKSTESNTDNLDEYLGVRFEVEAVSAGEGSFIGRYTVFPSLAADTSPLSGVDDIAHPSMDRRWRTENEALSYAAQAAHSAIEVLIYGRTQGQGHRSVAAERRLVDD